MKPLLNKLLIVTCFQINKRGAAPEGGGEIVFKCPNRQTLKAINFTDPGKVKRIRGIAYPSLIYHL